MKKKIKKRKCIESLVLFLFLEGEMAEEYKNKLVKTKDATLF